ncbi:MAG: 2-hydroxyacyl-CoA dehydratase [Firmicutes bacterium]|nr:2-hydroxyacyl-CoA dehydratase [Bacillota bacterium]
MRTYSIGLDIGSTTIKTAVIDADGVLVYHSYERHLSDIKATLSKVLAKVLDKFDDFGIMVTGSGGISASSWLSIPFIQEVVAGVKAIETYIPDCDVAIELGGEDAKITYLTGGVEQRMNGSCAGGTGAFIDQMAALLDTDAMGLNELAKKAKTTYPIASRCGVFAKSDIQPLINEGADKSDIALSIFHSVVMQTISGLACGKPIRGTVAFLGGPLYFLSELGKNFVDTLKPQKSYFPENSQIFNALGAALSAKDVFKAANIKEKLKKLNEIDSKEVERLPALFNSKEELAAFKERHAKTQIPVSEIKNYKGAAFLGVDAGSTTTKVALIGDDGSLLYSWYGANHGDPLATVTGVLKEIYTKLPKDAFIGYSVATGYGEHLFRAALKIDAGEIETMAHQTASNVLLPGVEFILDIGGQDMKCLKLKDGIIRDILLNEACSSGCGSFIETFASALKMSAAEFAQKGTESNSPVDLGSRCTVFMNSRVKQAQKEGATVADISAGLAYSVVKNALFKVIKLRDEKEIGDKIIVQGGTFLNDSVLRAFELTSGKEVVRPTQAGLMGAYGAALLAKEKGEGKKSDILTVGAVALDRPKEHDISTVGAVTDRPTEIKSDILSKEELDALVIKKTSARCHKCNNKCLLTISDFGSGKKYITNNRCEKGGGKEDTDTKEKAPNMFAYKYERCFGYYKPLDMDKAPRGKIGIPRVLNLFENYPFWFTFFTELGYRVELSPHSTRAIYDLGVETMPSESVCYPAKLVHGHIESLIADGHKSIFYPCIPYEIKEDENSDNHYNCPVVSTYPEVARNNMQESFGDGVKFIAPFIPYNNPKRLAVRLAEEFPEISKSEIKNAVGLAVAEDLKFKADIVAEGKRVLAYIEKTGGHGIVLAGRPYHIDPEVNHGMPEMIADFGLAVLTEDAVSSFIKVPRPIRVVDQWMYHSRLYSAAAFVRERNDLDLVQLNSFGCGLDAVTTDQVNELLAAANKSYTTIKIDEVNNLGAARIRIRSLLALINERKRKKVVASSIAPSRPKPYFSRKDRDTYTIIAPQMSPVHFKLVRSVYEGKGFNVVLLPKSPTALDTGLKYVNNDACYPTILTLGQTLDALLKGDFDLDKTAVLMAQTGGGCRFTNYIAMMRKALEEAGMPQVPVLSLNFVGLEKTSGHSVTIPLMIGFAQSVTYGDLLIRLLHKVRPYEVEKGSADKLFDKWMDICCESMKKNAKGFKKNIYAMVKEFDALPVHDIQKPKVGVVGEIFIKFHPVANNFLVDFIESEGGEVVLPDLLDFFLYCFYNDQIRHKLLDASYGKKIKSKLLIAFVESLRRPMLKALKGTKFGSPIHISKMAESAEKVVSLGNLSGEGWFLTAEMVELIKNGTDNIVCVQPFACLPNHVTGKGTMKELKRQYPKANIVAVDYDPGASEVNQINRIKLMMNTAFKNMGK